MSNYPEHDKLEKIRPLSQAIGEFIETSGYTLCHYNEVEKRFFPAFGIQNILADYFDIDLDKIEAEKRQMLEELRA